MERVRAETVGISTERLQRIRPVMQAYVDRGRVPGLVTAVARDGKTAHLECFGLMDIEAGKAMEVDTLFQIQWLTKPVVCAAAMMLLERGYFQLNDPVSNHIPEFQGM